MVTSTPQILLLCAAFSSVFLAALGIIDLLDRVYFRSGASFAIWCFIVLAGLALLWRHRKACPYVAQRPHWLRLALAVAAVALPFLPALHAALMMASGSYAGVFFNVDSPYHLSQVFSLLQSEQYPPESLNNAGIFFNYHFGPQLLAAVIARTFALTPNFVYFALLPGLFLASAIACLYFVALKYRGGGESLALLFLLLADFSLLSKDLVMPLLLDVESFGGGFPHISVLIATCLFVFLVYCYELHAKTRLGFIVACALPVLVVLFKSPLVFPFCAFALGYAIVLAARREFDLRHLLLSVLFAGLFFYIASFVGNGKTAFKFVGLAAKMEPDRATLLKVLVFLVIPFSILFLRSEKAARLDVLPYLSAVVLPLLFYFSFDLLFDGNVDRNLRQILLLGPFFMAVAMLRLFASAKLWPSAKIPLLILYLAAGGAAVLVNRLANLQDLRTDPRRWHEYVDNQALAECLVKVPVQGSMLVTNDLRYPANNFARPMMQMQIPALFGHRMYAGNLAWEKYFVDKERFHNQDVLSGRDAAAVAEAASRLGWTHAVLFKRKPFVQGDWPVVCENSALMIIAFQR